MCCLNKPLYSFLKPSNAANLPATISFPRDIAIFGCTVGAYVPFGAFLGATFAGLGTGVLTIGIFSGLPYLALS